MTGIDAAHLARAFGVMSKIRSIVLEHLLKADPKEGMDCPPELKHALRAHADHLQTIVPEIELQTGGLLRHIHFNMLGDYRDIIANDLPFIEAALTKLATAAPAAAFGFEALLHPHIVQHAMPLYAGGHYRQCIMDAYVCVFTEIRRRTGRHDDGRELIGAVFSDQKPILAADDLTTETGRSVQRGMLQLLQGAYWAFRNPLAHPRPDLVIDAESAARHMITASVLLFRVDQAKLVT